MKKSIYKIGKYKTFKIYESKERIIKSLPFKDRIVHQWYVHEFIKKNYVTTFIKDTYACIDERGTHLAVSTLQKYMRKMKREHGEYYILKCDIKKYFDSINKDILYDILCKRIKDKKVLNLTHMFIYENNDVSSGIPIGNYTSQYFANIYMNGFDHYIKEVLKVKYYVRYLDDFILLLDGKEAAKKVLDEIASYLKNNLKLELNQKTNYQPNKMGCNFCGYRIFETHRLLRVRSKRKNKKNIRVWQELSVKGELDKKKMELMWKSWKNHASHSNSYNLTSKLEEKIKELQ